MELLAALTWPQWFMAMLISGLCVLLILVILLQRGRGGGVASAFGGGGGSAAFGAKTGDVFTLITVVLAGVFLVTSVVGVYIFIPSAGSVEQPPELTTPGAVPSDDEALPAPAPSAVPESPQGTQVPAAKDSQATPDVKGEAVPPPSTSTEKPTSEDSNVKEPESGEADDL